MIKCKCLSKVMKETHGDTGYFEIDVARKLERAGHVEIAELPRSDLGVEQDTDYLYKDGFEQAGSVAKIAWVQDYDKDGGAELSNYLVVKIGKMLGYDIVGVTSKNLNLKVLDHADIIVLNNFFNFRDEFRQLLLKTCYSGRVPYVKYEHDHREITERKVQGERLFMQSALNVFISPLQMRNHLAAFGDKIGERSIVLPLAIDTEKYRLCPEVERVPGSTLIPSFNKCVNNTLDHIIKNPDRQYTVIGHYDSIKKNVKDIPPVLPDEMPKLYNQFETVLHLPQKVGGGERVVFEAALCGCKVITNENSAHTTWKEKFDWENRDVLEAMLQKAPYEFWRAVCQLKR